MGLRSNAKQRLNVGDVPDAVDVARWRKLQNSNYVGLI